MITEKKCSKCGVVKAVECFSKNGGGLRSECKECFAEMIRKRYHENPEAAQERSRKWQQENPEAAREANRKWYQENSEAKLEVARKKAAGLSDSYIAHLLKIPVADLTPELAELKREQLLFHRLNKEIKQAIKETSDEQ